MTVENHCSLCKDRVCTQLLWGRKIDDNKNGENNPDKIKVVAKPIKDCELRESLAVEDNKLELGC